MICAMMSFVDFYPKLYLGATMSKENKDIALSEDNGKAEIAIIDERSIRGKIYIVRGVQVMLDFDLAEIYGYTTKAFNQQVKRNVAKFPDDFMFTLTREEIEELSRSQNVTSIQTAGVKGGRAYLPTAFTESGVYMLMTILKSEIATRQSIVLIRTFRAMKDYIIENQPLLGQRELLRLSLQTSENTQSIQGIQTVLLDHDDKLSDILCRLNEMLKRSEISPFLLDFSKPDDQKEYLLLNGQPAKADETYIDIYSRAKETVYIVDDYINIKTLRLLQDVKPKVTVTVFSDNRYNKLHLSDYTDFQTEFPNIPITFQTSEGMMHDRFIVLDYGEPEEQMFLCGASSKDAGVHRTTAIVELTSADMRIGMHGLIEKLKTNSELVLS